MHYKAAYLLVTKYDKIHLGKFNTKSILSNKNKTISSNIKRYIALMSPYKFRERIIHMAHKYGAKIILKDEYLTTKTCSRCGRINEIGRNKKYNCVCGFSCDRDENAAKNIYKTREYKKGVKKVVKKVMNKMEIVNV